MTKSNRDEPLLKSPGAYFCYTGLTMPVPELRRLQISEPSAHPITVARELAKKSIAARLRTELPLIHAPADKAPSGGPALGAHFLHSTAPPSLFHSVPHMHWEDARRTIRKGRIKMRSQLLEFPPRTFYSLAHPCAAQRNGGTKAINAAHPWPPLYDDIAVP
jgi:hypothetical protein